MFHKASKANLDDARGRALSLDKTVADARAASKSPRHERKHREKSTGITIDQLEKLFAECEIIGPDNNIKEMAPKVLKMLRTAEYAIFEKFVLGWTNILSSGAKLQSLVRTAMKTAYPCKIAEIKVGGLADGLQELLATCTADHTKEFRNVIDVAAYMFFFVLSQKPKRVARAYHPIKLIVSGKRPPGDITKVSDYLYDSCVSILRSPQIDPQYLYSRISNLLQQLSLKESIECCDITHVKVDPSIDQLEFTLNILTGESASAAAKK